ncbi:MAG TPA: beta-eliminating lyase-related protein, partial [Candidatus Acidoferrales bacterium]|nr:beta-eliminating lyase-related protein [Candidatus Acidoferrales bacterium]
MSAPIDLRSDTVTRPTPAMRRAMAEAEVGDDVYSEDPTINRLESRAAELFAREAALFVPSGSMGNLLAIWCWTDRSQEVICDARSHTYVHEMGAMSAIAG